MQRKPWRALPDVLTDAIAGDHGAGDLAELVYSAVDRYVPFDFACFALSDPATGLVTWTSKTRSLGAGDEEKFAAAEYGPPDINSFAEIARRTPPVGVLSVDTDGHPERCRRHRDLMLPRFGFTDEIRVVFASRGVSWGVLGMYRAHQDPPFTAADGGQIGAIAGLVGAAIARSLFRTTGQPDGGGVAQVVMIVDAGHRVTHLTASAEQAVQELGGWDHGSLPSNVLAVVAATRTRGTHTETVVHTPTGRWLTLRAAPLSGPAGDTDIVVTVEPTPRAALGRLALAAYGLTAREEDVALLVLQGASTQAIAGALHLSPHTVQDHLKKIFGKAGVTSRRDLTARLALH